MHGAPDGHVDVTATCDLDRLDALLERHRQAVAQVGVAGDLLEVEVGDVGAEVGEPPGDLVVVADDDPG